MTRILRPCRLAAATMLAAVVAYSAPANATTISQTLGGVDFANGQTVAAGTFNSTSAGQPAPFNAFNGSDVAGPNFSATWTFSYGAVTDTITGATLEIGLLDGDSAAPGSQVASYSIGSTDLTSLLNTVMEATPGANSVEVYYTITLPSSTFSALAGGSPTVSLTLQGPGLGVLGTTAFNGAALDFSTVTIDTSGAAVPLPATLPLFATGIGGLGLLGWRRKRKAQAVALINPMAVERAELKLLRRLVSPCLASAAAEIIEGKHAPTSNYNAPVFTRIAKAPARTN